MRRIIRDRHLTPEEAEKYKLIREQVEKDLSELIERHWDLYDKAMTKLFQDLKAFDQFTDAFQYPSQTKRWVALEDAKDEKRSASPLPGNVWSIQARCVVSGEEKTLYAPVNTRVDTPK